jgi:hypothetical protein
MLIFKSSVEFFSTRSLQPFEIKPLKLFWQIQVYFSAFFSFHRPGFLLQLATKFYSGYRHLSNKKISNLLQVAML